MLARPRLAPVACLAVGRIPQLAGASTPLLTTHLAVTVIANPLFAIAWIGLILTAAPSRRLRLSLDRMARNRRTYRPWSGRSSHGVGAAFLGAFAFSASDSVRDLADPCGDLAKQER